MRFIKRETRIIDRGDVVFVGPYVVEKSINPNWEEVVDFWQKFHDRYDKRRKIIPSRGNNWS